MPAAEEDLTSGSGGVYRKVLRPGREGEIPPPAGSDVTVHYEGWLLDGQKFDSSRDREEPFTFKLGVGQVIEGWDLALAAMRPGEVSSFTVRADYAYGWEGKPPKIPVDATLRFEIELIEWKAATKPIADMSVKEKRAHGFAQREEGTKLLRGQQYAEAVPVFEAGVESLSSLHTMMLMGRPDPKVLKEVADALRSCYLNLAQCSLKLSLWEAAAGACTKVLMMRHEDENVKALYRRGLAQLELHLFEQAKDDLRRAAVADPTSKEVRAGYDRAKQAHAAYKEEERAAFGGKLLLGGEASKAKLAESDDGPALEVN